MGRGCHGLNISQWRGIVLQAGDKLIDGAGVTFQVHEYSLGVIMHGAGKAMGIGQAEHVGPESHTLNYSPDSYDPMFFHGMLIVAQYCIQAKVATLPVYLLDD